MITRHGAGPEPLVDAATIYAMEVFFTSLIVAAGAAISFVAVVVLRGLYRGQK